MQDSYVLTKAFAQRGWVYHYCNAESFYFLLTPEVSEFLSTLLLARQECNREEWSHNSCAYIKMMFSLALTMRSAIPDIIVMAGSIEVIATILR